MFNTPGSIFSQHKLSSCSLRTYVVVLYIFSVTNDFLSFLQIVHHQIVNQDRKYLCINLVIYLTYPWNVMSFMKR